MAKRVNRINGSFILMSAVGFEPQLSSTHQIIHVRKRHQRTAWLFGSSKSTKSMIFHMSRLIIQPKSMPHQPGKWHIHQGGWDAFCFFHKESPHKLGRFLSTRSLPWLRSHHWRSSGCHSGRRSDWLPPRTPKLVHSQLKHCWFSEDVQNAQG